jgi:hypothetical protein
MRRLATFFVLMIAACDPGLTNSGGSGGANPPGQGPAGPTGTISLAQIGGTLPPATTDAKLIVKRHDLVTQDVFDPETGQNIGTVTQDTVVFSYIENIADPANATVTLNLPIGNNYTFQLVAGGAQANKVRAITALKNAAFDLVAGTAPTITWADATQPSFTVPKVYVGLSAPYDKYTVSVDNVADPLSNAWTLKADGASPMTGTTTTFEAPTTGNPAGTTLTFTGTFELDSRFLLSDEITGHEKWRLTVVDSSHKTEPFQGVVVP